MLPIHYAALVLTATGIMFKLRKRRTQGLMPKTFQIENSAFCSQKVDCSWTKSQKDSFIQMFHDYLLTWNETMKDEECEKVFEKGVSGKIDIYLVSDKTEFVAFMVFLRVPHTFNEKDSLYLEDLYVTKKSRNRGLGSLLIRQAIQLAKEGDYSRLYWHSYIDNAPARKVYDKFAQVQPLVQYRINPPYSISL